MPGDAGRIAPGAAPAITDEDRAISKQAPHMTNEIEQAYDDEDTVMMKRLIEIRNSLWT